MMIVKDKVFVGGEWVAPAGTGTIEVISPTTEEVIGVVPEGTEADIDRAVAAARQAFETGPWPRMSASERADIMANLSAQVASRAQEFADVITAENGTPLSVSLAGQAGGASVLLDYYAGLTREFCFEEERQALSGDRALVRREPGGVVGAVIPWNGPLTLSIVKLAPVLATGCTLVLKPAPETPLDAYLLADCIAAAGVPRGVINIVAAGREVGEHLVTHPDVDKVSFTGSTAVGRRIAALCGERLRRVNLELGGKSAAIICDDADLATTIPVLVATSTMINGQACVGQTRILASRTRYSEVVDALVEGYRNLKVGDPREADTAIGPLVAERQRARVEGYIALGQEEGAKVAIGGGRPSGLPKGWYVEPTVFVGVENYMRIAQEEIFGPVTAVIPFDDLDDAVAIANDSSYGLSGTVWTKDGGRGLDIARQVRTGTFTVNGFAVPLNCPYGGYKSSGLGRELGPEGLDGYLEYKTISLPGFTGSVSSSSSDQMSNLGLS
jgi:betaine-aldehyde dehydrogenase